jgi:hypothetical protein
MAGPGDTIERLPTGISDFDEIALGGSTGEWLFTIDDTGMHIGEPLPRVAHVLSGSAALTEHPPWPTEPDAASAEPAGGR